MARPQVADEGLQIWKVDANILKQWRIADGVVIGRGGSTFTLKI
jgi:hypothetical protein